MSGGPNGSNIYQYPNLGTAAGGALTGAETLSSNASNLNNLASTGISGLSGLTAPTAWNPQQSVTAGQNIQDASSALQPYISEALSAGFNPGNATYASEFQQNQDATNAELAQRGISMSPYGAGVASQSDLNFNNAWYNNELARQGEAAQTASNLLGGYSGAQATGAQTAQGGGLSPLSSLSSLLQSGNLPSSQLQSAIADYLTYLSGGTSAATAQDQVAQANQNSLMSGLGGLGSLLGSVATTFL